MGGTARNRIARLNADGTLDTGFDPNANGDVYSVAVQADGKILLGGDFTTVGGTARNYIARLNADGTLDTGFNPNANSVVYSVAVQADGKILLGGDFTTVGGTARNYIARLNADGTLDPGFNPNANDYVYSVAVQADGKILLGGGFTTVGGTARNHIARLLNEPATQTLSVPDCHAGAMAARRDRAGSRAGHLRVEHRWRLDLDGAGQRRAHQRRLGQDRLEPAASGLIRARGRATAGYNGSSSLIEQVASYALLPDIGVLVAGTNLVDGVSTVSFGTNQFGQTGPTLTFTVTNAGPGISRWGP